VTQAFRCWQHPHPRHAPWMWPSSWRTPPWLLRLRASGGRSSSQDFRHRRRRLRGHRVPPSRPGECVGGGLTPCTIYVCRRHGRKSRHHWRRRWRGGSGIELHQCVALTAKSAVRLRHLRDQRTRHQTVNGLRSSKSLRLVIAA
jgi:hypothetical protein